MAVELANAYVTLAVETRGISKQVGRMFGGVESQAGKTGRNMGRQMASSFDKAKPNVEVLEQDVKRAQDRVVAHKESGSRKMEAANRRVEIAQAKVNEATKKYGPDSSQALRAQDQLITAQQKAEAVSLEYNDTLGRLEGQLKNAQTALSDASVAAEKSSGLWGRMSDSMNKAGDRMRGVGDSFKVAGQSIGDVGSDLTRKITLPIGGAIAAAGGLAAALGFKRLVGIDTAKAQIQGLGFDAEKVMDDVDKGLTNTSMSMADGAAVARAALATGNVEVGKDLEAQVKRVANVSAAYGIEANHAGYLLNNVLTKNKVTWGDLSQMQQNQIPIVSQLADHYGVTGEEIEKMAQEGKISIEDLNQVLDDSAGKSAEEYAKSWKGITENIGAYISRLGAEALGGLFETLKEEASGLVDVLSSEKAAEFARALGEHLANALQKVIGFVRGLVGWFAGLSPMWQKVILGAVGFAVALGPILIVVGKIAVGLGALIGAIGTTTSVIGGLIAGFRGVQLAAGASRAAIIAQSVATKVAAGAQRVFNAVLKANPIGLIITAITALVAALVWFFTKTEVGQELWSKFTDLMVTAWDWVTEKIGAGAMWLWEKAIQPVFDAISSGFSWLWESVISPVVDWIVGAWSWLGDVFTHVWDAYISPVFDWIGSAVETVKGAWGELTAAFSGGDEGFGFLASFLGEDLAEVVVNTFGMIGEAFDNVKGAWGELTAAFRGGDEGFGFLSEIFGEDMAQLLVNAFGAVGDAFRAFKDALVAGWNWITDATTAAYENYILPAVEGIGGSFIWLWENAISSAIDWIVGAWQWLGDVIGTVWENYIRPVFDGIGTVVSWLWQNIFKPFVGFIIGMVLSLGEVIVWVWQQVLSPVVGFIGTAIAWLWKNVFLPYLGLIGAIWKTVFTGIAWAWNNILSPIIGFIGAAVMWLWENAIKPYLGFIGAFWSAVFKGMGWAWDNILMPVFEFIGAAAVWLWEKVISPYLGFIGAFWSAVFTGMVWAWDNLLKPAFIAIGTAAVWLWENALQPTFSWIGEHWSTILDIMAWAWEYVLKPVFNGVATVAMWLWEYVLSPVFSWIGDHWSTMVSVMSMIWEYVLKPVFTAVGWVATNLWEYVLKPVFSFIAEHWSSISSAMLWVWDYILEPVFRAVGAVASWLWEYVLQPVFTFIGDHWHLIIDGMVWVWNHILKPAWEAVAAIAMWLWEKALEPIFRWIGDHWDEIVFGMKLAWENYLKPAWDRMVEVGTWLWEKLSDIFSWIGNKWSNMKDRISNIYYDYIKPVFDTFGDAVEGLKGRFESAVENIKKIWDRLKGIAARPIKFVIQDIFNNGLINALNKIPGVNISDIPEPGWVSEYATGGHTGPGSKWKPAGIVHADEYVVQKASRRPFERENPGLLDHINRYGTMSGYAKGGLVQPVRGPVTSGFGAGRGRYPHAGIDWAVPVGTPVSAALAGHVLRTGFGNVLTGRTGYGVYLGHAGNTQTYYGHLSRIRVKPGQEVAKGQTIALSGNTGRSTGPHLHFETHSGGKPLNPAQFLGGAAIPAGAGSGPSFFDPLGPFRALGDKIATTLTEKFPNAGYVLDASIGLAKQGFDSMLDWAKSKIPFMGDPDDGVGVGGVAGGAGSALARSQVNDVAGRFGWASGSQWSALQQLVQNESGWNPSAANPHSTARGLFQKMTSLHGPLESSIGGQANWGLNYIRQKYGTPTRALAFWNRNKWYADGGLVGSITRDSGGVVPPGSNVINNWTRDPEWMYTNKQQDTVQAALDIAKNGSGARMVFNAPVYMRDEDDFIEAYNKKARRSRAVGAAAIL